MAMRGQWMTFGTPADRAVSLVWSSSIGHQPSRESLTVGSSVSLACTGSRGKRSGSGVGGAFDDRVRVSVTDVAGWVARHIGPGSAHIGMLTVSNRCSVQRPLCLLGRTW
jgi:hypothetical protein